MGVQGLGTYVEQKGDFKLLVNLTQAAKNQFEKTKLPLVLVVDGLGFLYWIQKSVHSDFRHGISSLI